MMQIIFQGITYTFKDVLYAIFPLLSVFLVFQFVLLRLPKSELTRILKGFLLTFIGFVLFLQGVKIGFIPIGEYMGEQIGGLSNNWILIPIGFILGFVVTFAEPAVKILNIEIEKVSGGYINKTIMLYFLSTGVASSVALSICRIKFGIPLMYFIVPGYIIAFILSKYASETFVAIAFDSGGVATGSMTVTFILALAVGFASKVENRNPILDGFGMMALVALIPILSILVLGVLYKRREKTR